MTLIRVLDHHHLKHPWQGQDRRPGKEGQPDPAPRLQGPVRDGRGRDPRRDIADPVGHAPDGIDTDDQQRQQLHHRLDRDGHDDAVVAFVGVKVAGAEEDGEDGKPASHPQRGAVAFRQRPALGRARGEDPEAQRHGLQLQRDIGRRRHDRDHRHDHAQQV